MTKALNGLCYILAALLLAAYVVILMRALSPEVSPEYRQYYIDHTLSSWPGDAGEPETTDG